MAEPRKRIPHGRGWLIFIGVFLLLVVLPFALASALVEGLWQGTFLEGMKELLLTIAVACVVMPVWIGLEVWGDLRKEKRKKSQN